MDIFSHAGSVKSADSICIYAAEITDPIAIAFHPDREGRDLVVVVVENPIINEIAFEGNEKIKKDALMSEVQLRPRTVLTRTKVQADVARVSDDDDDGDPRA